MASPLAFETDSTWYESRADRPPLEETLNREVETETCIVGAGLAGLYLARELSERKREGGGIQGRRGGLGAPGKGGGVCGAGWGWDCLL